MAWTDMATEAIGRIASRLARRVAAWAFVGICALVALYHATIAGTVALELKVGPVYAHLIIGSLYVLAAAITVIGLWLTARRTRDDQQKRIASLPPEFQVATIVEAMLLGYSMSRRR